MCGHNINVSVLIVKKSTVYVVLVWLFVRDVHDTIIHPHIVQSHFNQEHNNKQIKHDFNSCVLCYGSVDRTWVKCVIENRHQDQMIRMRLRN